MRMGKLAVVRGSSGQSLVETVLVTPILLIVVLNAVNFGYLILVALNLAAAPRAGVEYSILGFSTPSPLTQSLPNPGPASCASPGAPGCSSVGNLTYQDMTGALWSPSSATIQVCSEILGLDTASPPHTKCVTCTSGSGTCNCSGTPNKCTAPAGSVAPDPDPEGTAFVLQRVAVTYTFSPLLNVPPFTIPVSWLPGYSSSTGTCCTFTRYAEMRAMN
jgi:hypothetical protein